MIYYLTWIKDTIGNNYIGLNIPNEVVKPYLDNLLSILGESDYQLFTNNQAKRDGNSYHITIINVSDTNKIIRQMGLGDFVKSSNLIFKYEIDDLEIMGIGKAQKGISISYFLVCKSNKLNAVRSRYDLPNRDFHITIGFNPRDVFGVAKDETSLI